MGRGEKGRGLERGDRWGGAPLLAMRPGRKEEKKQNATVPGRGEKAKKDK